MTKVTTADEFVLQVRGLGVRYQTSQGTVHAVSDVSFEVRKNEVFGIAGESGCGKSTLIRALLRLLPDNADSAAELALYRDQDLYGLSDADFRQNILWQEISLVPQSAMNSLNPVYRVGDQVVEAIRTHRRVSKAEARGRVAELFDVVGLQADLMQSFPHEFSGGMRQRAMIAMSLALDPGLIIMDEPTTGLDVLVQERILRRIREIRSEISSSIILITHDIAVIAEMSDRIAIMYGGQFMEQANAIDLFENPYHPYTLGLKNAFPSIRELGSELISIPGSPPTLVGPVTNCPFQPRCPFHLDRCASENPLPINFGEDHQVRCFRSEDANQLRHLAAEKSTWRSLN
ncbi:MAG: ABC transporter ATP-binding protein [Gammaproteobacteria bacterium]|nr:ABC transporter ATP-binding protein [Gammaproteobacteria bacterium]MDH3466713.1 ABC transporter ATP-binding protein [Gammaproteobacteria bacterium]